MQIINTMKALFRREDPRVTLAVCVVGAIIEAAERKAINRPARLVPKGPGFPCNISLRAANDVYQGEKILLHKGEVITISALRLPGGPYDVQRANGEAILLDRGALTLSGSIKPHSKSWDKIHRCAKRMADFQQGQSRQVQDCIQTDSGLVFGPDSATGANQR